MTWRSPIPSSSSSSKASVSQAALMSGHSAFTLCSTTNISNMTIIAFSLVVLLLAAS
jgi:hypothetical protein